jgi:hypothetical protein
MAKCQLVSVYTATTIAFVNSNPDTLTDSASGFAGIAVGASIVITGSTDNNKPVTVASVIAGTITLVGGDALTAEIAGDLVSLTITVQFSPIRSAPPAQRYDYGAVELISKISGTRFEYSNFKKFYDEVTVNNESKAHARQYEAWREHQTSLTYTPNLDNSVVYYTCKLVNESVPLEMRPDSLWDTAFHGTLQIREV